MPQHLFVYGTLRFEYPNPLALKLKSQAIFIDEGSAPGVLYDLGWYPGAVFNADARTRVIGEIYALGNAERLMAQLDDYEAIPEPNKRFHRMVIKVRLKRAARSRRGLTRRSSFPQPGASSRAAISSCIFSGAQGGQFAFEAISRQCCGRSRSVLWELEGDGRVRLPE
jgi:gamma-glutamylcyclotransferase (GGCT)/AIG2-like uncharacterized protein YtfP